MLYVSSYAHNTNSYNVCDTDDWSVERVSYRELLSLERKYGLKVQGVDGGRVTILTQDEARKLLRSRR